MRYKDPMDDRAKLELELRQVEAKIDAAYWAFTRQARAMPPSVAEPEAYRRRAELWKLLGVKRGSP